VANKRLRRELLDSAKDLHQLGQLDKVTLREFETLTLPPIKTFSPSAVQRLRKRLNASQAVFARYLNISVSTIRKWETGEKHPSGMALMLLNLIDRKGLEIIA
jgi:putative transcriptional regulator